MSAHIPTMEENLRSKDIDATKLFAASNREDPSERIWIHSNSKVMNELLGLDLLLDEFNQ